MKRPVVAYGSKPRHLALVSSSEHHVEGSDRAAPPSLDELYRAHSAFVARLAFRLLGREAEVDDVVHDVFVDLMRQVERLRDLDDLRGWLTTVTTRTVYRHLRRSRLRTFVGLEGRTPAEATENLVAETATPEQAALVRAVYRALGELPVEQRIAWTLRHVEDEGLESVATRMGLSLATVKRKIAAAAEQLRRILEGRSA